MYSEENRSSGLAKFLSNYDYVYLDTCSLMEDGFPLFMDALVASKEYWKEGLRVIVPNECVKELKKHTKNKEKNDARIGATRALKILRHDRWHGKTIEIEKGITDGDFGDQAITQAVIKLRIKNKILIITQDKTLTRDLLNLNQLGSQHGQYLDVYKITPAGELTKNLGESGYSRPIENKEKKKQHHAFDFKSLFSKNKKPKTKEENSSSLKAVEDADKKLAANLRNANYPVEKKLADINSQIASLSRLSSKDKKQLSITYTEDRLLKEKETIIQRNMSTLKTKEDIKVEPHAHFEKPLPKKTLPNLEEKHQAMVDKRPPNAESAFKKFFAELGVIVRDDSVTYVPEVHGPLDVTKQTLSAALGQLSTLKADEEKQIQFGDKIVAVSFVSGSFVMTLKNKKTPQKATEKVENKAKSPSKKIKTKTAEKVGEKPAVTKGKDIESKPKKEEKPKEKRGKKEKENAMKNTMNENEKTNSISKETKTKELSHASLSSLSEGSFVLPDGVSLFVGEPHERKRPQKKEVAKSSSSDAIVEKKVDVKQYLKKSSLTSHREDNLPKEHNPELLQKAMLSELKLNANIHNPTYPLANKIRDLRAQDVLIDDLNEEDQKQLKLTHAEIEKKLKELMGE